MLIPLRSGVSLVELLVSLVLVDLLALGTLHAALQTRRIARDVAAGGDTDIARLEAVRLAATAPSCQDAPIPSLVPLSFPSRPNRPAITVLIRCGR